MENESQTTTLNLSLLSGFLVLICGSMCRRTPQLAPARLKLEDDAGEAGSSVSALLLVFCAIVSYQFCYPVYIIRVVAKYLSASYWWIQDEENEIEDEAVKMIEDAKDTGEEVCMLSYTIIRNVSC